MVQTTEPRLSTEERDALHEFEEAMMLLKQALRKLRTPMHPELGEHAIAILGVVRRLQPTRVSSLAAELGLAVSTVSRKIEPLVQRGWLEATPDENDQRAHHLSLTKEGMATLRSERRRQMTRYMELLDEETRAQFPMVAAFLGRVAQTLHAAADTSSQPRARKDTSTVTTK